MTDMSTVERPAEPMGVETEVWDGHHWVHDPDNCWCSTDDSAALSAAHDKEGKP